MIAARNKPPPRREGLTSIILLLSYLTGCTSCFPLTAVTTEADGKAVGTPNKLKPFWSLLFTLTEDESNNKAVAKSSSTMRLSSHHPNRRDIFRATAGAGLVGIVPFLNLEREAARADSSSSLIVPAESTNLPTGLLESRVLENVVSPPPYGMETTDIVYPNWLVGTWNAVSTTTDVLAPCGPSLFGSNATYMAARKEVGTKLSYECRFVPVDETSGIADREYNVKSIAKAAIGPNSVVDIPLSTPNKLTAILGLPSGLMQVDLLVVRRRQEGIDANHFDCSEVVREIVSPVGSGQPRQQQQQQQQSTSPILKEIETTSLYSYDPNSQTVKCRQRSASFLLPSQTNPLQYRMWEASRGRPVDVRFYDVVFSKS